MKCIVTGRRHAVLGKRRGEVVYLDDAHAARLIAAGHVEPAPDPPPKPKRRRPAPKSEPRQDAGLSHVTESAPAAEDAKE